MPTSPSGNPPLASAQQRDDELIAAALRQETLPIGDRRGPATWPARIGPYRIVRQIGVGGMGVVYEAEQEQPLRRRVALKVIKLGMDTREVVRRFEIERQALAVMNHPNIARVYDAGATEQGRPYFAMEYVPGIRITDYCDQYGLSTRQRLALFVDVCQAIQHAHQKGVIHRDIKPSNILVTVHDGRPVPKVIDFGVAKAMDDRGSAHTLLTERGHALGTPPYMSPEQLGLLEADVDTRTDIYSLGAVLYESLVGVTPYPPQPVGIRDRLAWQRTVMDVGPVRPSSRLNALGPDAAPLAESRGMTWRGLCRELRGDLDWITLKALEKDRVRRYASAAELALDIQRHLDYQPVVAGPPSRLYAVRKFLRRNRALVLGVAGVFVVLLAGVIASTLFSIRETQARRAAQFQTYIANIAAASAALDADDTGTAQRRLAAVPEEFRGYWEWRYLWARSDESLTILRGHEAEVWAVAVSPDGRLIASGGEDRTIRLWDLATGRELRCLRGHDDIVYSVAFSPDGQCLVSGSEDKTVRIWDVNTGCEARVFHEQEHPAYDVVFSSDGRQVASAGGSAELRVWNTATGVVRRLRGHGSQVFGAVFSADGTHLVSVSLDKTARIWDLSADPTTDASAEVRVLRGHTGAVRGVALSPDDWHLATGSFDGTVRIWDLSADASTIMTPTVLVGHRGRVQCVAFSPDGRTLAAGSDDNTIRTWDIQTGQQLALLRGHAGIVQSIAFTPDGRALVSAGRGDRTVRIWDVSPDRPPDVLENSAGITKIAISPDARSLATLEREFTVHLWDLSTGRRLVQSERIAPSVLAIRWNSGGDQLMALSSAGVVHTWSASGGWTAGPVSLADFQADEMTLAFNSDATRLAAVFRSGTTGAWSMVTGEALPSAPGQSNVRVLSLAWDTDDAQQAVGMANGDIRIEHVSPGTPPRILRGHTGGVVTLAFSADAQRLVSGARDRTIRIWDLCAGSVPLVLSGHTEIVQCVVFSPDETRVASASDDGTVRIWDAHSGIELLTLRGHHDLVRSVAFTPDGTRLLSASEDGTVRIWDAVPRVRRAREGL